MGKITKWLANFKHSISKEKCCAVFFGHRYGGCGKTFIPEFDFSVMVEPLAINTHMKYLGVIIDQNLTFKKHLEYLKEKTKKLYFKYLRLFGNTWGASHKNCRIVYQSLVESNFNYCASVYINRNHYIIRQLNMTQRPFTLNIGRCYRTVSTIAAQVISKTMPLDLSVKLAALSFEQNLTKKPEVEKKALKSKNRDNMVQVWQREI